jgi:GH24 family phage-related lysozyme (muramidase)
LTPRTAHATGSTRVRNDGVAQTSIDDPRCETGAHELTVPALCAAIVRWEGCRREMYVDVRGDVRTGVGHLLEDASAALALPWCHRTTGRRASAPEIRIAFARARAQGVGHRAPAFQRALDLVLPAGLAGELLTDRIERTLLPGLRRLCPHFDRYPLPAQRALVEMAFDVGLAELSRFHRLIAACEREDFGAAADHCHRRSSHSARNVATRGLFREAATRVGWAGRAATSSGSQRELFGPVVGKNARLDGRRR